MARIPAGRLNRSVTFERQAAPQHDGYSRAPGAWSAIGSRTASVKPARGREGEEGQGRSGIALMSFWLRYDSLTSSITEQDAIIFEGRRYQITAPPMEVGRREGIEIFAIAGELENASEPIA
jgi:SPP1 family predicted phage head-tail adaptor